RIRVGGHQVTIVGREGQVRDEGAACGHAQIPLPQLLARRNVEELDAIILTDCAEALAVRTYQAGDDTSIVRLSNGVQGGSLGHVEDFDVAVLARSDQGSAVRRQGDIAEAYALAKDKPIVAGQA